MNVGDALAKGREYLESHDWIRGHINTPHGEAVCSFGALLYGMDIGTETWQQAEHIDVLMEACGAITQVTGYRDPSAGVQEEIAPIFHVTAWNDRVALNREEVIEVFAKAEKMARLSEQPAEDPNPSEPLPPPPPTPSEDPATHEESLEFAPA